LSTAAHDDERHYVLPDGVPAPEPAADGLDAEFWAGLEAEELRVQECRVCGNRQFPEWICHACHSFDLGWVAVRPEGVVFTWERVWNASHAAIGPAALPYVVVLVELSDAPDVRMVGNLVGDPMQPVEIGAPVDAVFEHHPRFTLVQWQLRTARP
jgi:uncharacterized OB-fold protein